MQTKLQVYQEDRGWKTKTDQPKTRQNCFEY